MGKLSVGRIVRGRIVRWANCPWANCPQVNCPRANRPVTRITMCQIAVVFLVCMEVCKNLQFFNSTYSMYVFFYYYVVSFVNIFLLPHGILVPLKIFLFQLNLLGSCYSTWFLSFLLWGTPWNVLQSRRSRCCNIRFPCNYVMHMVSVN